MEYEVYRHKNADPTAFENMDAMFKRILSEDKWLCNNAQKNLNAGVFVNGEMHPTMEKGPLFLQNKVRDVVLKHHKQETTLKREIWPARQKLPTSAVTSNEDDGFCDNLKCDAGNGSLQW